MGERIVHTFPSHGFGSMRLVAMDVTDPTVNARFPYAIVRAGVSVAKVTLAVMNRDQLEWLRDSIDRELAR